MDSCTALHITRNQRNLDKLWTTQRSQLKLKTSTKIETPLKSCIFSIILGMTALPLIIIMNYPPISINHKALIITLVSMILNIFRIPLYLNLAFKRNIQNMRHSSSIKKRRENARNSARVNSYKRSITVTSFLPEKESLQ